MSWPRCRLTVSSRLSPAACAAATTTSPPLRDLANPEINCDMRTMLRMEYASRQKQFQQTLVNGELDGFAITHPANLRYLCGYTGSNGLLLFLAGRRILFTDGRYTKQAHEEVKGARVVIAPGSLLTAAAKIIGRLSSAAIGFESDLTSVATATQMKQLVH